MLWLCLLCFSCSVVADLSTPDALDLQVEYWTVVPRTEMMAEKVERSGGRKEMKCSLKMSLHLLRVFRNPTAATALASSSSAGDTSPLLSMVIVTPEKKQKSEYCWWPFSSFCIFLATGLLPCRSNSSEQSVRPRPESEVLTEAVFRQL